MTDLPEPLVAPDVDISKLDGFMLDTVRLLGSELVALSTGDEFKAAVLLWCRAWKQKPAASLPDDDRILASFAAVTPAKWRKIKAIALRGFVKCSDGRLYHNVLSEDVMRAHRASEQRRQAVKKRWQKEGISEEKPGVFSEKESVGDSRQSKNNEGLSQGKPLENNETDNTAVSSPHYETDAIDGTGEGKKSSVGKPTDAPRPVDPKKPVYDVGKALLAEYGIANGTAGGLISKWLRESTPEDLLAIFVEAGREVRGDIKAFVGGCIRQRKGGQPGLPLWNPNGREQDVLSYIRTDGRLWPQGKDPPEESEIQDVLRRAGPLIPDAARAKWEARGGRG